MEELLGVTAVQKQKPEKILVRDHEVSLAAWPSLSILVTGTGLEQHKTDRC